MWSTDGETENLSNINVNGVRRERKKRKRKKINLNDLEDDGTKMYGSMAKPQGKRMEMSVRTIPPLYMFLDPFPAFYPPSYKGVDVSVVYLRYDTFQRLCDS